MIMGRLEVSYLCHNVICVNPTHFVLETYKTSLERTSCKSQEECTKQHVVMQVFQRFISFFLPLSACLSLYKYGRGGVFQAAQEVTNMNALINICWPTTGSAFLHFIEKIVHPRCKIARVAVYSPPPDQIIVLPPCLRIEFKIFFFLHLG